MCVNVHNRAIRLCHPSHSIPLALILPRGDQWYLLRKPLIRRDKGDTLSLLVQFLFKPWVPRAPPPASLLLSRLSGLAAAGPTLSFLHIFLFPPKSPPFPTWRLQLFWRVFALLRLSSAPPIPPNLKVVPNECCLSRSPWANMCLCVFFPSILDIKSVGRTSRGHTGGRSHRISHPPSFCGACLNFLATRIQPFLSLVDREVEFCVLTI